MELSIGQSCAHYKILSLIGIGGMGEVYLAEDINLHRQVALKFLPQDFVDPKKLRWIRGELDGALWQAVGQVAKWSNDDQFDSFCGCR